MELLQVTSGVVTQSIGLLHRLTASLVESPIRVVAKLHMSHFCNIFVIRYLNGRRCLDIEYICWFNT